MGEISASGWLTSWPCNIREADQFIDRELYIFGKELVLFGVVRAGPGIILQLGLSPQKALQREIGICRRLHVETRA